jgi:hypothetical protein
MGASCLPKNGRRKAMHTVDATRAVLSIIEHDVSFKKPSGRSSSKLRANGFNSKAYLVVAIKDEEIPQRGRTIIIKNGILENWNFKSKCHPRKLKLRGHDDDKDTWWKGWSPENVQKHHWVRGKEIRFRKGNRKRIFLEFEKVNLGLDAVVTVVHSATFEATECFGRFKVIWDNVFSPNMRKPMTAKDPYIAVQIAKLQNTIAPWEKKS